MNAPLLTLLGALVAGWLLARRRPGVDTVTSGDTGDAGARTGLLVPARVGEFFETCWPVPSQARSAARLFTGSVALACAGALAAVGTATAGRSGVPGPDDAVLAFDAATLDASVAPGTLLLNPVAGSAAGAVPADAATATTAPPGEPVVPAMRGALPVGKGMWLYEPGKIEGGDPHAIAARAVEVGITHLYVRTGSSRSGFYAGPFLDQLLPVAHANGIRVYGWDFPYFDSWSDDVYRALDAIRYTTPDGHRIDGFSADIETWFEGTHISAHHATAYGSALRDFVGPAYPLIATIPRPSKTLLDWGYPFAEIVEHFDAVAPMVYWMNREPGNDLARTMEFLAGFGKPVIPIGQAYDGAPEGGPPGPPSREEIIRFMQVAEERGALGVSFWSWQHADQEAWDAIRDAAEFRMLTGTGEWPISTVRAYQGLLSSLGFVAPVTGVWDGATAAAVGAFQRAARLPVTATVDERTRALLLAPFAAPLPPAG